MNQANELQAAATREQIIAAMSVELEKCEPFRGSPVSALVWASRLYDAAPSPPSVQAGEVLLLKWLGENQNCELSFDYGDADEDGKGWCVHRVNGGVNDREWTLIGSGETPEAAIRVALISGGAK